MKKFYILCLISFFAMQIVFAGSYYTSRTGEILQVGTNEPIKRNMKASLNCNTFSFSYYKDRYYMIKDSEPYSRKSLLGCEDYSITNIFDPLVLMNSDKVLEKITSDELKNANIRFVKLKSPMGKLDLSNRDNDFDIDKIAYIDLNKLNYISTENGTVKMYLKPKSENSYYNNAKYMKELIINIQKKSKQQADRMF